MNSPEDRPARAFTLLGIILGVIIVVILIGVIIVPGLMSSTGHHHQRASADSLKTIAYAESDFRANDRDWNRLNDFWTGDVKGLYTMTSAAIRGNQANTTTDPAIKLIELSLAAADADPTFFPAGGENATLATFAVSSAKGGYWFAAMDSDGSVDPSKEDPRYRQDTSGHVPMGSCQHLSRFGFVCFPDSLSAGKYVWIVNEGNTLYRSAITGGSLRGPSTPPGVGSLPTAYRNWPSEADLKKGWSKTD